MAAGKQIKEVFYGSIQTTNATVTSSGISFATAAGENYYCEAKVIARDAAGNRWAASRVNGAKNVAGTLTSGTQVSLGVDNDAALVTCAAAIVGSGTNLIVNLTGVAATTIDWIVELTVIRN